MADFEIKVPITLKGGKEGEKVGKQIGNKIAEQIKSAYKSIGIGGGKTKTGGEVGAISGLSKGLGKVALKLGAIVAVATGILSILKKSSPYLRGILSLFGRAFSMFFRPFGDFLASLLRPLAVLLLRLAVKWLQFTRSPTGEKIGEKVKDIIKDPLGVGLPDVKGIFDFIKNIDLSKLKDFGPWLWGKLTSIWNYAGDFGNWILEKLKSTWNYVFDFGLWLGETIKTIWNWTFDFGSWLWEKLTSIWNWSWDFGGWVKEKLMSIFDSLNPFKEKSSISSFFPTIGLSGGLNKLISNLIKGEAQVGNPFVQSDGLYKLHRGEQVISRGKTSNNSVVFRPTFQITGNISQDIDMDAIVRRASRVTEMELKKRGIL